MDLDTIIQMARDAGFTHAHPLDPGTIELKADVRRMCEANLCGQYGKRWSCPPGCGSLEDGREKIASYSRSILVQTVGLLEDELDGEGMMDAERVHKERFQQLYLRLKIHFPQILPLGAGCCTQCQTCTYPDAPCRFPEKQFSSMEAYGVEVMQVCRANGLSYYYGKCTIAYTSCYLLD